MVHRNTGDTTPYGYCGLPDTGRYASTPIWGVDLSGWHTRAGRWTGDRFCAYLDDVLVHCLTPYDSTAQPMHLVLSIGSLGACAGCRPRPPELEMQVDWVRVWQRT